MRYSPSLENRDVFGIQLYCRNPVRFNFTISWNCIEQSTPSSGRFEDAHILPNVGQLNNSLGYFGWCLKELIELPLVYRFSGKQQFIDFLGRVVVENVPPKLFCSTCRRGFLKPH
jgi:hypothetical protein